MLLAPVDSNESTKAMSSRRWNGFAMNRSAPARKAHSPVEKPDAAITGVDA